MPEWLARVRPWINALLILLLLLPVASLSWRLLLRPEPKTSTATQNQPMAPLGATKHHLDLQPLRQAALFDQANHAGPNGELPESTLALKLQGVIAAGDSPCAVAIFDSGEPKLRAVRVGMEVQPGVMLKAVYKDRAVINNRGWDERMSLQRPPEIPLNTPAPSTGSPMVTSAAPPASMESPPPGFVPQVMGGPPSNPGMPPGASTGAPPGGFRAYGGAPNGMPVPSYQPPQRQ